MDSNRIPISIDSVILLIILLLSPSLFAQKSEIINDDIKNLRQVTDSLMDAKNYSLAEKLILDVINNESGYSAKDLNLIKLQRCKLLDKMERYSELIDYGNQQLEVADSNGSQDSYFLGRLYRYLGFAYSKTSAFQEALNSHQKSLKIWSDLYGQNSKDYSFDLTNISNVYVIMGKYTEALDYQKRALKIKKYIFGDSSLEEAINLNGLGVIYFYLGEYNKSNKYHEQALKIRLEKLGKNHNLIAASYNNLGINYASLNQINKAEEMFLAI